MQAVAQLQENDAQFFWSPKIAVQDVPGQGNSVVCVQPIDAGETVIRVPASMLVNVDTIEGGANDAEMLSKESIDTHELLARELLRRRANSDAWVASMPQDFSFLPVLWPAEEQKYLPKRYRDTATNQSRAIAAYAAKCELTLSDAAWSWLAVNSRCLYWAKGGMTLAPGIDFLNHTGDQSLGLAVVTSPAGMSVKTTRAYAPSMELTFCYGPRENGFLLVEYGFTMSRNIWEFVDVTEYVAPLVSGCKAFLEEHGYYGDWTLDSAGEPSFRVEVALAAAQSPSPGPVKALINGFDDGQRFRDGTAKLVTGIVRDALADARAVLARVQNLQLRMLYEEYIHILSKV